MLIIVAATAKIAVFNGSGNQSLANPSDGMNAYYDNGTVISDNGNTLNPHAQDYGLCNIISQHKCLMSQNQNTLRITQSNSPSAPTNNKHQIQCMIKTTMLRQLQTSTV